MINDIRRNDFGNENILPTIRMGYHQICVEFFIKKKNELNIMESVFIIRGPIFLTTVAQIKRQKETFYRVEIIIMNKYIDI